MLLLTVLGAVLVLTASGRTWVSGQVSGQQLSVSAGGGEVSGLPSALALVGLASAVAVFAVRGLARVLVGALVALAGFGVAVSCALGAGDTAAVDAVAARKLALVGTTAEHITHTLWPWVGLVGGLLLAAAGLLTALRGRGWPAMGTRYDAPVAAKARPSAAAPSAPADLWKALDRGEDPTAG